MLHTSKCDDSSNRECADRDCLCKSSQNHDIAEENPGEYQKIQSASDSISERGGTTNVIGCLSRLIANTYLQFRRFLAAAILDNPNANKKVADVSEHEEYGVGYHREEGDPRGSLLKYLLQTFAYRRHFWPIWIR